VHNKLDVRIKPHEQGQEKHLMKQKLILSLLFFVPLCGAQSVPTPAAPAESTTPAVAHPPDLVNPDRERDGMMDQRPVTEPESVEPVPEKARHAMLPEDLPRSRKIEPLKTKSEFELFAEDAAGHPLTVYGRQLFDQAPTTFAAMDSNPVPAEYVLGPGDELLVRVWGKVDLQSRLTVDRDGQIFIPKVGSLMVAGLRYEELQDSIHSAIASLYKGFDLNVTMGQLRSIQVFVLGSARQPGVYTVSSLSTLVNALFTSGGPSATGSMRHIQLRRANQVIAEIDVYDLLRNGDKTHDAQLLPGDVIYIPPVGGQTAILGSVKEPGIYELKSESTVGSILKDVAGLTNLASVDRVLLERVENHRRRQVDEFALDNEGLRRELKDGDILRVFPISPQVDNAVTLRGNVAYPGRYQWHEGMRVSDLIPSRESLLTREYWNRQNSLASTGVPGQPTWDRPRPKSDTPTRDVMADVADAGTEINWEYAAIERRDDIDLSTRIIAFNLGKAIETPSSSDNQPLKPGDVVAIFSQRDVPLPQEKHPAFARVGGEVNAPGVYRLHPGETLRELVIQAGGLTSHSYLYASQLNRESTRAAQEQELKVAIAQMQRELTSRYAGATSLSPINITEQQAQLTSQQALLAQLTAARPTGRIVLDMLFNAASISDIPDFVLEDGDSFFVPATLETIQVAGAVYNENAFRYQRDKRLATYLKAAGGPTRQADRRRVFLIRADGTVISRQNQSSLWRGAFENLRLQPGDSIVVPTKLKSPGGFMQQLPFITQILSQTAMTGSVIGIH
jgi:polysaccharide export outer membrane protein